MSNLSVKSVTNRYGFVVTLEETGKGHIKVWGNGVTLAQEQTIELRDWLNERYPTQPAAGEPEQQTAINADDLPTKKYPLGAFDFDSPAAAHRDSFRTWLAAEMPVGTVIGNPAWWAERILKRIGAAAHGDEAVRALAGMTDLYSTAQDELDAVRRDAERYRWLRDPAYTRWGTMFKLYRAGAELDEAIDAAMRAQASEGGE